MVTLKEIWEKFEVLISQRDRLQKSVTVAPNDRYVVAPYVQPVILFDSNAKPVEGIDANGKLATADAAAGALLATIDADTGSISTNSGSIATNTGNTATNTGTTATNTGTIATNSENSKKAVSYHSNNLMIDKPPATPVDENAHRVKAVPFTCDGSGASLNLSLVAAVASYKGRMRILGVVGNTTDATVTFNFQDEDDSDLAGQIGGGFVISLTANTINTQLNGIVLYSSTAQKGLEVDVSTYGAGATGILYIEYWYEA